MPFSLNFPRTAGDPLGLQIENGDVVFVLGANGAGKSALMHHFFKINHDNARRISAHRQTWLNSSLLEFSAVERRNYETNIRGQDSNPAARWREEYAPQRSSIALYDLVDAENVRAREITSAVESDDMDLAKRLAMSASLIKVINGLFRQSNIPIELLIERNEQITARKDGSEPYGIAELSDGERNALVIAATVLTVAPGSILLIDEPERHLHRSIISPLLTALFAQRSDGAFVVSTHDLLLPIDNPSARTLLLRSCTFEGREIKSWDADLLPNDAEIDDPLKEDIIGGRRRILFIEGNERSLDLPLYSLLFPMVSVIPKESSRDVEHAVIGIRFSESLHWLKAWGLVDNDRRTADQIEALKAKAIYALPFYSVESVYYHPQVLELVAVRAAALTGDDAAARVAQATDAALKAINAEHLNRLSARAAEKAIRERVLKSLPTSATIAAAIPIDLNVDVAAIVEEERLRLAKALEDRNLLAVISRYPIRETPALGEIANRLGFQNQQQYEKAVRTLIMDDPHALKLVQAFFGPLMDELKQ